MLQAPHIYVLSSVVPEADDLLLLIVHQPPLAASFGGTVLVAGAFLEHAYNLTVTSQSPAVEVAVSRLTTNPGS